MSCLSFGSLYLNTQGENLILRKTLQTPSILVTAFASSKILHLGKSLEIYDRKTAPSHITSA